MSSVRALPATAIRPRHFDRDDVVVHEGLFSLVNSATTPRSAWLEDLLALGDVLDSSGLPYRLMRGNDGLPFIAVDKAMIAELSTVLADAFAQEPFYVKTLDKRGTPPRLVAGGIIAPYPRAAVFSFFRPRVSASGSLRYGSRSGVRLELWKIGTEQITAPAENVLMRKKLPLSEAIDDDVTLYGRTWPTFAGMFEPLVSDIRFDVDIVFSWVDGTDIDFQRARAARMASYVVGEGDDAPARYRQIDELKYALRSVYMYAPWVRHIYIVTDSPRPRWLAEHPDVTVVRSEDHFRDLAVLPTHNSHAVESQLHRIPGLSEHFLYSNDDMFFGRDVDPNVFFSPGGVTKFIEATTRIGMGDSNSARSGFENAARVNRALLRERFGAVTTRHLEHAATPLRKSVMSELEQEFEPEFRATAAARFRSATDISVTNSLYHYYALMTGRAVVQENSSVKYVDTTMNQGLKDMRELLKNRAFDFFCLNDGSFPEISAEDRAKAVLGFLDEYYPIAAPWEVEEQ
ncbi:stealth conserved region 3 domain-containing protein [Microbacteriaceae bacterium VKM Ac-2854]|nr:stealth conserved region 3 domain-containing protein [Microbacteriaceae bacterium VKM Ac-2854]